MLNSDQMKAIHKDIPTTEELEWLLNVLIRRDVEGEISDFFNMYFPHGANLVDGNNRPMLFYAARKGHIGVIDVLRQRDDFDVNIEESEMQKTPLVEALEAKEVDAARKLFSLGAEITVYDMVQDGRGVISSALYDLLDTKDVGLVKLALRKYPDILQDHHEFLGDLLIAQFRAFDTAGAAVGMKAKFDSYKEVVKVMVDHLHFSIQIDRKLINELFVASLHPFNAVVFRVLKDDFRLSVRSLKKAMGEGCKTNYVIVNSLINDERIDDEYLESLFRWSVRRGLVALARTFLESGRVDVNSIDSKGGTPMHNAAKNRDFKMIKILQEYEPDLTFRDANRVEAQESLREAVMERRTSSAPPSLQSQNPPPLPPSSEIAI